MEKVKFVVVVVVVFLSLTGIVFSAVSESSSFLEKIEKIEEAQTLQYCEGVYSEFKETINFALENSDSERLFAIARDFLMMAEKSYDGSYNLEGQYFMYVRINLWTRAEGLRGNKVSADKKETLDRFRVGLKRVLKKYNMELPLPNPPDNFFEKAESEPGKCLKCN